MPVAKLELVLIVVVLGLEEEYWNTVDVFNPPNDAETSPSPVEEAAAAAAILNAEPFNSGGGATLNSSFAIPAPN